MSDAAVKAWIEANQTYLHMAMDRLLEDIGLFARKGTRSEFSPPTWPLGTDSPPALEALTRTFGLSPFETWLVLLCTAIELDPRAGEACAAAQEPARIDYPTFALAMGACAQSHWSALSPASALRHWGIINVEFGSSLLRSRLRIDERILHYLQGVDYVDERLSGLMKVVQRRSELIPSHQAIVGQVIDSWFPREQDGFAETLQLTGPDQLVKREIARQAAAARGLSLLVMPAHAIPEDPHQFENVVRLWQRESALTGSVLLVEVEPEITEGRRPVMQVRQWIDRQTGPILISSREPISRCHDPIPAIEVKLPTHEEQADLWFDEIERSGAGLNGEISRLVAQFNLSAGAIKSACRTWQRSIAPSAGDSRESIANDPPRAFKALWNACRARSRTSMDELAQRIVSRAGWEDLVLPEEQTRLLHECVAHVRHRYRVYREWGFGLKSDRGLGITALFHGPSGSGKTLAAEILAGELQMDLYRIDLSSVVSRYIGETESNLRHVFDAAEEGGAVLLFDEADALYGKRSEVRDSHDRHANIEVSYLLQRMEAYSGLAILTTNMKEALDDAFFRRIRFMVSFPFPNETHREAIWRTIFPTALPTKDLDFKQAARLSITGGSIRNIAVHAAFMAADEDKPVQMRHLLRAARVEYGKLERPMHSVETEAWT